MIPVVSTANKDDVDEYSADHDGDVIKNPFLHWHFKLSTYERSNDEMGWGEKY